MTDWPAFKRGGYLLDEAGNFLENSEDVKPRARLMRVTGILDWAIKGDGFGAMAYYGGGLMLDYMLDGFTENVKGGVLETWKESYWDPNRKLKRDAYRGTQAHMLYEQLCQGKAELVGPVLDVLGEPTNNYWVKGTDGLTLIAEQYEAGVCQVYDEVFRHFDPGETLSEVKVHWTEHPIADCPDEVCQHGYAGTLDQLIPAERIMADVKTNKGEARWAAYPQMAMYGRAALQMGLIDGPIEKQIVVIPRPEPNEDGKMYDLYDDKFVGDEVVDPVLELYKLRRAWGPR